jgi:hypothetical protein
MPLLSHEQAPFTTHDLVLKLPLLNFYLNALTQAASTANNKDDARCELIALNMVLRNCGAPQLRFGAIDEVPVGTMVLHRTELVVLGLHRHFLSEMTYTCEGVESLVLTAETPCEDEADRVAYRGCGQTPAQRAASRCALATSAERGRPVRLLRAVSAEAATNVLRVAGEVAGRRRREVLRYDGLYGVQRLARDELGVTPGDDDDEHDDDPSFVLVRLPGQPLLPSGAATGRGRRTKRARDEAAARRVEPLVLHAEAVGVPPGTALPPAAEELCLDPRFTVHEALKRLHSARERLLLELGPQGRYALVKRAALHQLRLRSALELLSAAYSVHSGFAEGRLLEMSTQLRPTLPDNLPALRWLGRRSLQVNGLYRHGFLIAPALLDATLELLSSGHSGLADRLGLCVQYATATPLPCGS